MRCGTRPTMACTRTGIPLRSIPAGDARRYIRKLGELQLYLINDINFVLQYFSNGLNAEPPRNWLFDVSAINHAKRTMIRLI